MRFLTALVCLSLLFSALAPQMMTAQAFADQDHEQPLRWQATDCALPASALTGRDAQLQRLWLGEFKSRSAVACSPNLQQVLPEEFRPVDTEGLSHVSRCTVLLQHVRLQL